MAGNPVGRPPSSNPRHWRILVSLTHQEHLRLGLESDRTGLPMAELLRRGVADILKPNG